MARIVAHATSGNSIPGGHDGPVNGARQSHRASRLTIDSI